MYSTSDDRSYFMLIQGISRFVPYPATDRKRKPETADRAHTAPRTSKKSRVVSTVRLPDAERATYASFDPYTAPQDTYLEPPRATQVKQSTSFVP